MSYRKGFLLVALVALLGVGYWYFYATTPRQIHVALQPFGAFDPTYLALAQKEVQDFYGATVTVLPAIPLPDSAYYKPQKRYRASILLQHLRKLRPTQADYIVGLTRKDISITKDEHKDWGILGLGYRPGPSCVVSTHRLGRSARNEAHKAERFSKVLLHELGHNLGLKHCTHSEQCMMQDACGSIRTIDKETKQLCSVCRKAVARRVPLPELVPKD